MKSYIGDIEQDIWEELFLDDDLLYLIIDFSKYYFLTNKQ
jgi:hypothetical protein